MIGESATFDESSPHNLVEPCNKQRVVLSRFSHASIRVWLTVQAIRSARVVNTMMRTLPGDVNPESVSLIKYHHDRITTIEELIRRVPERIKLSDWADAEATLYDRDNPPQTPAAGDDDTRPDAVAKGG